MIRMLVDLVIYVMVVGIIIWLLLYLIDVIPLPEPFHRVARVAIIVVGTLIVILLLLSLIDGTAPHLRLGDALWPLKALATA